MLQCLAYLQMQCGEVVVSIEEWSGVLLVVAQIVPQCDTGEFGQEVAHRIEL